MPAKKKKKIERKIKVTKTAEEEVVGAITLRKATFSYVFGNDDGNFAGMDIIVYYDELDDFDTMKDETQKTVLAFEVDGSTINPDISILREYVEDLISIFPVPIDVEERTLIVDRIMHNVKHFIYVNTMKLGE